jgi:murein DD-endopeptidase MepM/ murein hydrolase activator NlpD
VPEFAGVGTRRFLVAMALMLLWAPAAAARSAEVRPGFTLPVQPPAVVLTPFDPPDRPYGSGHRGVDLAAPAGTAIRAAAAGTVVFAGQLAGRGVVSVQHRDGIRTTYEPVQPVVSSGDDVVAGQLLARLDAGHPSCAPAACLHWGARIGPDDYLDPMLLLNGWPVRLLPWDG